MFKAGAPVALLVLACFVVADEMARGIDMAQRGDPLAVPTLEAAIAAAGGGDGVGAEPLLARLGAPPSRAAAGRAGRRRRGRARDPADLARAIRHFRGAVAAAPSHAESRYYLGVALLDAGQAAEGRALVERAPRPRPPPSTTSRARRHATRATSSGCSCAWTVRARTRRGRRVRRERGAAGATTAPTAAGAPIARVWDDALGAPLARAADAGAIRNPTHEYGGRDVALARARRRARRPRRVGARARGRRAAAARARTARPGGRGARPRRRGGRADARREGRAAPLDTDIAPRARAGARRRSSRRSRTSTTRAARHSSSIGRPRSPAGRPPRSTRRCRGPSAGCLCSPRVFPRL